MIITSTLVNLGKHIRTKETYPYPFCLLQLYDSDLQWLYEHMSIRPWKKFCFFVHTHKTKTGSSDFFFTTWDKNVSNT